MRPKRVSFNGCGAVPVPAGGLRFNVDEGFPHERADGHPNESGYRDQNSQMQNDGLMVSHGRQALYPA